MKIMYRLRWTLLGTSGAFLVAATLCEWRRITLQAQSDDVLQKGYGQYTAEGQTLTEYFTHSIIINNRLAAAALVLTGLSLLFLVLAVYLFTKYRSGKVETDYLNSTQANRKHLEKSMASLWKEKVTERKPADSQ